MLLILYSFLNTLPSSNLLAALTILSTRSQILISIYIFNNLTTLVLINVILTNSLVLKSYCKEVRFSVHSFIHWNVMCIWNLYSIVLSIFITYFYSKNALYFQHFILLFRASAKNVYSLYYLFLDGRRIRIGGVPASSGMVGE